MNKWINKIIGHEDVPPEQLLAHPDNWRIHPAYQQKALKGVIDDIGYIKSVTVNKRTGRVVDGHLRVTLALRDDVPLIPVEYVDLTEEEEAEALLTLDPIAALAGADKANLEALLQKVKTDDADVMKLLAETADKAGLDWGQESKDAEPQIDRAAELLEKWQVKTGDLWQIGEHRLICGDCTDAAVVVRVMGGEKAQITTADPPYGIGYEYDEYDDVKGNEYTHFCDKWFSLCLSMSPVVVVTTGWAYKPYWYSKKPKGEMVWFDKTKQSGHSTAHLRKTEPIFVFGKVAEKWDWDIFEDEGVRGDGMRDLHTCPKPVSLWEKLIEKQSNHGGIVYEPFSGSGTTIVACQNLGRKCRAIEISPAYVAVALERMATAFPELEIKKVA